MYRIMNVISWIVLLIVAVAAFLFFTGRNDLAHEMGTKIVQLLGYKPSNVKNPKVADQNIGSNYNEINKALGWDIRELKSKTPETIVQGIDRLDNLIYDLEQRLKNDIGVESRLAGSLLDEKSRTKKRLKAEIDEALKYIDNPSTVYPVEVNGFLYASRESLVAAVTPALATYKDLAETYTLSTNTVIKGTQIGMRLERQILAARSARSKLKAALPMSRIEKIEKEIDARNMAITVQLPANVNEVVEKSDRKSGEMTGEVKHYNDLLEEYREGYK